MLSFRTPELRFQFRAAAIIEHDGAILLHRAGHEDFWTLPGGRVEAGESAQHTVAREFFEELGEALVVGELAVVVENFFTYNAEHYHELGFFFRASLANGSRLRRGPGPWRGIEPDVALIFQWFDRDAIGSLKVQPAFLQSVLTGPIQGLQHVVHRDPG